MSGEEGLFGSEGLESQASDAMGVSPARRRGRWALTAGSAEPGAVAAPFDPGRLRASVERARVAASEGDPGLVDEVVDIVTFTLASQGGGGVTRVVPGEIGAMVERTLVELGQAGVAREFILTRDRRARARAAHGATGAPAVAGAKPRLPLVEGRGGSKAFDAGRVAAGLVEEAGLGLEDAARVAGRVEAFLGGASLRSVTSSLLRELVNHTLLEGGFQGALRRHEAVGLPRRDLTAAFHLAKAPDLASPPGPCAWSDSAARRGFSTSSAWAVSERWVLEDVLSPQVAEAHRRADLKVLGVRAPDRLLTRSIPVNLLGGRADWSRGSAFGLVRRVGLALQDCARGLFLEDLAGVLAAVVEPGGAAFARREAAVVDLIRSLGAAAETAGRSLGLVRFGGKRGLAAGRLIRAVHGAASDGGVAVQLYATYEEVVDAIAAAPPGEVRVRTQGAVEGLLGSGHLVPVWAAEGARWVGPGCTRGRRDRGALAVGSAAAINLPRLARIAGPWREERFLQLLLERVATAVEATGAMAELQAAARHSQGELISSRIVHALVPVGLGEALRILGDGVAKPEQGAQILGVLRDAGARLGRMEDLQVEVTGAFQHPAAQAFALADAPGDGPMQARLFDDLPRPEVERVEVYSGATPALFGGAAQAFGGELAGARGLAALLGTTPAGALFPALGDVRPVAPHEIGAETAPSPGDDRFVQSPRFGLWGQFRAHCRSGPVGGSWEAGNSLF